MPQLPLPAGESSLAGGDLPVSDAQDVLNEFPIPHRKMETATVRDAFTESFGVGHIKYQTLSARAAAQCDPMRATGDYLRAFAEERGIIPGANESDESIRTRLFAAPEIVTPEGIRAVVNRLLAGYTDTECTVSELDLDGWFVHDGTAEWDSFVGADPDYGDRYYEEQPWLQPGGAVPSWGLPRNFVMRIPPLEENDTTVSYALDDEDGIFIGDGSDTAGAESDASVAFSVFVNPKTADELYKMVVGVVETIKGQGITWTLHVDPSL